MRIRTVKPEFWSHPVMARQDDATVRLAIGLLNLADDQGVFLADAALVRSALRPFDDDSTIVRRALAQLVKVGWIEVREHPSQGEIGRVVNFEAHQRIDRPAKPKLLIYFEESIRRTLDDHSTNARRTLAAGKEGKGTGKGKDLLAAETASGAERPGYRMLVDDLFADFESIRRAKYQPDGRDWKALKALRLQAEDGEIRTRWRRGLVGRFAREVNSFRQLADSTKWNALATDETPTQGAAKGPVDPATQWSAADKEGPIRATEVLL